MRKILVLSIMLVLVGVVLALFLMPLIMGPPTTEPPDTQFQWGVSVGDEFLYSVKVHGSNNNASIPVPFVKFNNTQIRLRVVSLPNVTLLNSSEEMIEIIEYLKTQCEFENGSSIPTDSRDGYYMNTSMPEMLSRAILPIGGWTSIESYFPNETSQYESRTHLSKMEQDWFYIGYYYFYIDFGYGWDANVSLSSGAPISIYQWESDPICIGQYSITLTLIDET